MAVLEYGCQAMSNNQLRKYCTIQVCEAFSDLPRKTHSCNPCQRSLRGVNSYINYIDVSVFHFKFAKRAKNTFLHYGVVHLIQFNSGCNTRKYGLSQGV